MTKLAWERASKIADLSGQPMSRVVDAILRDVDLLTAATLVQETVQRDRDERRDFNRLESPLPE
jgi:hypothetical protein